VKGKARELGHDLRWSGNDHSHDENLAYLEQDAGQQSGLQIKTPLQELVRRQDVLAIVKRNDQNSSRDGGYGKAEVNLQVGQVFLERSTVVLKDVPKGYTHITSGLGEATPKNVLIVPMIYNEKTEGVVEIAGFEEWKEHQRHFMDKATEYMAAALSSVRSTYKMKLVLEQMQTQTEQLHAQEEEMRQNMEELAATNEEMKRKEAEYLKTHVG